MKQIGHLLTHLARHADGYWTADERSAVSFPEGGHDLCYSIEEDSFWFQHRNDVLRECLHRFPPQGTLWDVGGGNGYVALALQNSGFDVVLVEPGPRGATHAVRRGLENVVCATLEQCNLKPGTLPAVGVFDVLEHVEDDAAFLRLLRKLIQEEGRLYITVPAHQLLWSVDDEQVGHWRRYSKAALLDQLEAAGFSVEYSTYFFWFLPLPILMFRTIPSRLGLRRESSLESAKREHSTGGGFVNTLVSRVLDGEIDSVRTGRSLFMGASCLAVARAAPG